MLVCTPAGFERFFDLIAAEQAGVEPPPEATRNLAKNGATPARSGGWQKAGRKGVRRETLPVEGCVKLARMATGYAIGPERVGEETHATVFTRHNERRCSIVTRCCSVSRWAINERLQASGHLPRVRLIGWGRQTGNHGETHRLHYAT